MFLFLEATLKKEKEREGRKFIEGGVKKEATTKDQQLLGGFGSVGRPQVL